MSHLSCLQVGSRPIRPLSSVILPRDQIDAIVADAAQFQASEAWYGAPQQHPSPRLADDASYKLDVTWEACPPLSVCDNNWERVLAFIVLFASLEPCQMCISSSSEKFAKNE